jgi:hypothetical protein
LHQKNVQNDFYNDWGAFVWLIIVFGIKNGPLISE